MNADERAAWLRLALTPGLGPRTARALLSTFGLPQHIFAASAAALRQVVPEALATTLAAPPESALARAIGTAEQWLAAAPNRFLLTLADADYPALLLASHDPPPLLFAEGRRALLATPMLAIVGSRSCSRQGAATAEAFAQSLARAGLTIVSGLASGIDAAAHRGALRAAAEGGPASTIAVVGTGIDRVYPAANRWLAEQIRAHGLLLSEFALGTPALAHNFPRRNRILAALGRGVLVVEAALHSGSLITARIAAELGREVFAIPGSIHAPTAKGCHRLIKEGAKLVESAADILEELRLSAAAAGKPTANTASDALPPPLRTLLAVIGHDPVDVDTLAARSGLDTGHLTAALLELELAEYVERLPGNRYQRIK
ncbi:MAG: DNA-processing protein DprA [Sutterellaceae bacterium]|nr:DNA-processing protein DprA [Burkholderiaceae bacterium]MCX7900856.1 DNA-processing protein DprA [Burkholderiaceae bacterium]MDW8429285.1 DNA-processing protein DprA [Sutterellaceae bacterium]